MVRLITCVICLFLAGTLAAESIASQPGVLATFRAGSKSDAMVLPNFWFYSPPGQPATPFLHEKVYELELAAFVTLDLRGEYTFQAELSGALLVEVNGKTLLETAGTNNLTEVSPSIRLNRGTNFITAKFWPPKNDDARLRLYWISKGAQPAPLPSKSLTHTETDLLKNGATLRRGLELLTEYRCFKCHTPGSPMNEVDEPDGPTFENIGSRLTESWMAEWIDHPTSHNPHATMPKLFRNPDAARAAAVFLSSLRSQKTPPNQVSRGSKNDGKRIFEELRCAACHLAENGRSNLVHVSRKYQPGAIADYLLDPQRYYGRTRMPNFNLTPEEAGSLEQFLRTDVLKSNSSPPAEQIHAGKKIVQTSGCLDCHPLKLENQFSGLTLKQVMEHLDAGCLSETASGPSPNFSLIAEDREAIRKYLLDRHGTIQAGNPREFAIQHLRRLNCGACHAEAVDFTALPLLGEKLRPEWMEKFISGKLDWKPRPWLAARMPAFPAHAKWLSEGIAILHGYPPNSPFDLAHLEHVQIGRKLLYADGGFSCISCHAIGNDPATQQETHGINLVYAPERLRKSFFERWISNPLAVDPSTKMPVYFDQEGRSQLADILGGDGRTQIEAMWSYLQSLNESCSKVPDRGEPQ